MPEGRPQLKMVLLVPELTFLTGLSDLRKNSRMLKVLLLQEVTWEMIQNPQQHYQRLAGLLRRIRDSAEASRELQGWGLLLDTDIYRVRKACGAPRLPLPTRGSTGSSGASPSAQTQAHILPTERINLRHRSFLPTEELGWHREVTKEVPIAVVSRACPAGDGWDGFSQVLGPVAGLLPAQTLPWFVLDGSSSLFFPEELEDKVQLLLCIIPGGRDDVYGAIKKLCCVQTPVPSQVINAQSLTGHPGKIRSVVQKVLLQMNCKLGGQLWGVDIPLAAPSLSIPSILTKWYSRVVFQMPHQEIADSLRLCLSQALKRFYELCHLYWNWPGTVRVPAPCKYAHKLALLVGQVLHHEPSAHLCEQLFFL
ncbi:Piwi-like protein 2 [Lonchura striata]|uniref:Piwi-like protein 2 n=1 Tax=Lonchura striata TaxID=40157 RepID=A0A218UBC1_9PASE|nr:Piwi-like protein 2 [Lonchura striata domestica]